ncbi:MAG: M23 family metallopeptidase, partial [Desulfuromonadales bacterium]|nr:M23 family metallopeptidase [Desulfuromonadales bacterium]
YLAGHTPPSRSAERWVFPLRGYDLATAGAEAAKGFVAAGYDYFDGNRHGGHPSFDLFVADRNQDGLDDRTGQPVAVLSMTGGIVVAVEAAWDERSALRGGKYLWIYDDTDRALVYYAHNRDILVKVGDRVHPGTPLAAVGRSGLNAAKKRSPTHLHLTFLRINDGRPEPDNIYRQLRRLPPRPVHHREER